MGHLVLWMFADAPLHVYRFFCMFAGVDCERQQLHIMCTETLEVGTATTVQYGYRAVEVRVTKEEGDSMVRCICVCIPRPLAQQCSAPQSVALKCMM